VLSNPDKNHNNRLLQQFRLQVNTELINLVEVLQWFERTAQPFLSENYCWQCLVALAEGFTNTVRYAHVHLPATTPIEIEVNLFADVLEIRIVDFGRPFDLKAKLKSLSSVPENPLEKEGDRGLFLMHKLMDDLQYIRLPNQRNCLIMRKKILNSEG
jgi:serine/threonine-protein kinase RsbW